MRSSLRLIGGGEGKKFWPIFTVFVAFLITDILVDFLTINSSAENISSVPWIALFVTLTAVFGVGQFFLLGFLKESSKDIGLRNTRLHKTAYVVTIIQYVLFAILLATSLQVILTSQYSSLFLILSNTVSLGLAAAISAILGWLFFLWTGIKKNFVVLLYGLSSVAIVVNMILTLVLTDFSLLQLPPTRTPQSEVKYPFFDPNSAIGIVQNLQVLSAVVYFMLLWVSTALLLHYYSQRIGKIKFWTIMVIPLASSIIQILVVFPYFAVNPQQNLIYVILGFALPGLISGLLFAIPFLTVSRQMHSTAVGNYLVISAIGIILFQFSTTAGILHGPYPPFGLYSVSVTGLSSFFILIGLYSSALSTAQDSSIRERIRKTVIHEAEMLGAIGAAEKEQRVTKKVIEMIKDNTDHFYEETGVQPSLTDTEMKSYLDLAIAEIRQAGVAHRDTHREHGERGKDDSIKRRDSEVE